jgi:hypothetical protein
MEAAMANEAYQYQLSDDDLRGMIKDTEVEIFNEAVGNDELDGTEAQTLADLSQSEGWDGRPLGDNEIAARTMQGDTGVNFDRPLQMETETTLAADNYHLRQQLDSVVKAYNEHVQTPQRQAAQEQLREQARQHLENRYGSYHMGSPEQLDRFIADNQTMQQQEENRIESSFQYAAQVDGQEFRDAHAEVTAMDPRHPLARQIVQSICASPDPGAAMTHLRGNSLVRSLARSAAPPFMPRGYGPPPHVSQPRRPSDYETTGFGDESVEREVFDSAFDDEGWQY